MIECEFDSKDTSAIILIGVTCALRLLVVQINSRDKVWMISHLVLQSLEEGQIGGISWSQTLFVLQEFCLSNHSMNSLFNPYLYV